MLGKKIISLSANPAGFGQEPDPLEPQMFASDLPVQHTHSYYENDALGLYVGVWDTTGMMETPGPYACDEFMWLLEGEVAIKNSKNGTLEKVQAGEAFVIPRGYDCQWQQPGYLRKFFVISEHPEESVPITPVVDGIVKLADSPGQEKTVCYEDSRGRFTVGYWQKNACESGATDMLYNHFVYIREGSLSLEDEDGGLHNFDTDDAFFVPEGVFCKWQCTKDLHAFYVTVKSASSP